MKKPVWFECSVEVAGWCYLAKCYIMPSRKSPHVGADSPRFMEPGHRTHVLFYSLYNDEGEEVTPALWDELDVRRQIVEAFEIDQTAERVVKEVV